MSATCPVCRASWSGSRPEHCAACHQTFVGTRAGDAHRVGDHALPRGEPGSRRCLSFSEMCQAGLAQDAQGRWFIAVDRERLAAAFRTSVQTP